MTEIKFGWAILRYRGVMRETEIEEVRELPLFEGMAEEQFVGLMKGAFLQ